MVVSPREDTCDISRVRGYDVSWLDESGSECNTLTHNDSDSPVFYEIDFPLPVAIVFGLSRLCKWADDDTIEMRIQDVADVLPSPKERAMIALV